MKLGRGRAETSVLQAQWAIREPTAPGASRAFVAPAYLQAARLTLLSMGVLLNPLLAIVNASVTPLNGAIIALSQAALVGAAFLVIVLQKDGLRFNRWWALTWGALAFAALLAIVRDDFNPRFVADTLILTSFVLLGAQLELKSTLRVFLALHVAVALIGLWELQWPEAYVKLFQPQAYYVNTRGYQDTDFWSGTGLFASGVRPVGRFLLSWTNYHRGSSVFLEPVSLGNWAVLSAIATVSFWRSWRAWERVVLLAATAICVFVCDGRLAMITTALMLFGLPLFRVLPSRLAVLMPLGVWAVILAMSQLGKLNETGDTVLGRLRFSLDVMSAMSWRDWLGLTPLNLGWYDAGYAYLIQSQSVILVLVLWGVLMLGEFGEDARARTYRFGIAIFISVSLAVSYSTLSIKTAAWLWALFGLIWAHREAREGPGSPIDGESERLDGP